MEFSGIFDIQEFCFRMCEYISLAGLAKNDLIYGDKKFDKGMTLHPKNILPDAEDSFYFGNLINIAPWVTPKLRKGDPRVVERISKFRSFHKHPPPPPAQTKLSIKLRKSEVCSKHFCFDLLCASDEARRKQERKEKVIFIKVK